MPQVHSQSLPQARQARPLLVAALVLYSAIQLWLFARLYFADSPLLHERVLLAAAIAWRAWQMRPRDSAAALAAPRPLASWVALLPGAVLLALAHSQVPSIALACYAFLLYAAGVVYLLGGERALLRGGPLLLGAAALVYLPNVVFAPVVDALLTVVVAISAALTQLLFGDVPLLARELFINGKPVSFLAGCSGYDFIMTYAAASLVFFAGKARAPRLAKELAFAVALAFTLNIVRILTMVALARAGYWEVALGGGHLLLGGVFIFVGTLVILKRADAA